MTYKELLDEIKEAVWGADENPNGIIFQWHDPFHNFPGNAETDENLRIQGLFRKFADKLTLDTKDENIGKILNMLCIFIGEAWCQCDLIESNCAGTKYDPEYIFDGYDPKQAKEPEHDPIYEVRIKYVSKTIDNKVSVDEEKPVKFYNRDDAERYIENLIVRYRELEKDLQESSPNTSIFEVDTPNKKVLSNGSIYEIIKIEQ